MTNQKNVNFILTDDEEEQPRDIVPMSFPEIKTENATGLYLSSKLNKDMIKKCPRFPPLDVARDSLCIDLVHSRRHLAEAEKRLKTRRKLARNYNPKAQLAQLEENQKKLRANFLEFDGFIRENNEKRERATKKLVDDKRMLIKKEQEISAMEEKRTTLISVKEMLEKKIMEYKIYEDYLSETLKLGSSQFKNIGDILQRYDALYQAKKLLGARHDETLVQLETARADLAKVVEDKTLILMGLDHKVMGLNVRYNKARQHSMMWESLVEKIESAASSTKGKINQVKECCYAVYNNMCRRRDMPVVAEREDFETQLVCIKRTLIQLQELTAIAQNEVSNEINSIKVEKPKTSSDTSANKRVSIIHPVKEYSYT